MLIKDAIRRAGTAQEICYLLTSYVETLQFYGAAGQMPACVTALPVRGLDDIAARLAGLQATQCAAPARADDGSDRTFAEEAANLFCAAQARLKALEMVDAANFSFDRRSSLRTHQALAL